MSETEIIFCIEREEDECELTITGDVEGYIPGNRRGHPDNWTPDEGRNSSIINIELDGKDWDGKLTAKEARQAEQELYKQFENNCKEAAIDAAGQDYEARIADMEADYEYDIANDPYGY